MTDVTMPNRYRNSGDRLTVDPLDDPGADALVCLHAAEGQTDGTSTHAHVHAHRASLLAALGAVEPDALTNTLHDVEQQRDAADERLAGAAHQVDAMERTNATLRSALDLANAELARERRAHARLADAARERDGARKDTAAYHALLDAVANVVGYDGNADGIPEAVSARLGEVIRERDGARDALGRIATLIGYPGVSQEADPVQGLLRHAEQREQARQDDLARTRKVSDERGATLDRITALLGCEPGDEASTLQERLEGDALTIARAAEKNRELGRRNRALSEAQVQDVTKRMTVDLEGVTRDVVVEPVRWEASLASPEPGDSDPVLGTAMRRSDGTWRLMPTMNGPTYTVDRSVEWWDLRDRLAHAVALTRSHQEAINGQNRALAEGLRALAVGDTSPA